MRNLFSFRSLKASSIIIALATCFSANSQNKTSADAVKMAYKYSKGLSSTEKEQLIDSLTSAIKDPEK